MSSSLRLEQELTLDGGFSPFYGTNYTIDASGVRVTFGRDPVYPQWCSTPDHCQQVDTDWSGSAMYVLGGTGQGQLGVFASGGVAQNRTWTLVEPFDREGTPGGGVRLDATSFVSVFQHRERYGRSNVVLLHCFSTVGILLKAFLCQSICCL